MNFNFVKPSNFLKKYIRYYCFMESGFNEADLTERVIPSANIQLMFHYKNPFVEYRSDDTIVRQPRSIISGLSDSFTDVSTSGDAGVVFISFRPGGACNFFRFPLSEVENQSIDLRGIFYSEIGRIEEILYFKASVAEKVLVIEDFLLKKFCPAHEHDLSTIQKAMELIQKSRGQLHASFLSQELYVNQKTLERKFSHYLGKSTKQIIKLVRFHEVLNDFGNQTNLNLTEIAYRNGYFDQSHFIRDFKQFSGYTPGEFLSRYPAYSVYDDACVK